MLSDAVPEHQLWYQLVVILILSDYRYGYGYVTIGTGSVGGSGQF
jgi:hypothetical protein